MQLFEMPLRHMDRGGVLKGRRTRRCLAAVVLAVLLASGVPLTSAQEQGKETTLRVTTRLVTVNVVVTDKKGVPLTNLTQDDFTLLDEGQRQAISLFSLDSTVASAKPAPLPPDTFTNRVEHAPGGQSATVILIDFLNTPWQERAWARDQVVKFLQQREPNDQVALFSLSRGVRILQDFTPESGPLLRALSGIRSADDTHVEAPPANTPSPAETPMVEELEREVINVVEYPNFIKMQRWYQEYRARLTADAMVAIANRLAPYPGRKNLIWVSAAFPIQVGLGQMELDSTVSGLALQKYVDRAVMALNEASVAIYPVDARGLVVGGAALSDSHATMNQLAERTGGRAAYGSNDLQGAIRRAVNDGKISYTLGYYPTHNKWEGQLRNITVRVNRRDADIRYRRSYRASAAPTPDLAVENRGAALRAEVLRPLPSRIIAMTVQVIPLPRPEGTQIALNLKVGAEQLAFQERDNHWVATLDLLYGQVREEGRKVREETLMGAEVSITRDQYLQRAGRSVLFTKLLDLAPDAEQVVIVVRDVPSGNSGVLSFPLQAYLPNPGPPAAQSPTR